jgi:hypothetical protein
MKTRGRKGFNLKVVCIRLVKLKSGLKARFAGSNHKVVSLYLEKLLSSSTKVIAHVQNKKV